MAGLGSWEEQMVRSAVDRAFLPAKKLFQQVGDMMILTAKTIVATVRPPYTYGTEFIGQFLFALQLCWFPMAISMVAVSFGAPGLQAANFLSLFGALDRLGGFFVLASIREFAPLVTAVVVAGVAGTAIIADLGARKIREELDALAGPRRRPGQEPRRPPLPGPDADHRADGRLRPDPRHLRRRRSPSSPTTSRSAASSPPSSPTPRSPTSGARSLKRPCSARSSPSCAPIRA